METNTINRSTTNITQHSYKIFGASPFGDISFIIKHTHLLGSIMMDCGNISYYNNNQVNNVTHLCISHTHMDHFYGFDRIIRSMLISSKKLVIFGPKGIIDNVFYRTQSYTWNLVDSYSFELEIHELNNTGVHKSALLPANKQFQPQPIECNCILKNNNKTAFTLNNGFTLTYEIFDHGIPSVGYRIESPRRVNISETKMMELGLKGGKWVRQLKEAYLDNNPETDITPDYVNDAGGSGSAVSAGDAGDTGGASVPAKSLFHMLQESPSESVTFATDLAPTQENIHKATLLAQNSSILIMEGVFMEEDKEQAHIKKHLTINIAKKIFLDSSASQLYLFHHSPRYEVFKRKLNYCICKGIEDRILTLSRREED